MVLKLGHYSDDYVYKGAEDLYYKNHVFYKTAGPIRLKLQGRLIHDPKRIPLESQLVWSSHLGEITEKIHNSKTFSLNIKGILIFLCFLIGRTV